LNAEAAGEVGVRRACGCDVPRLLPLCIEHAAFERLPHGLDGRSATLAAALDATPPRLHAWLAYSGERAVGYATATVDFSTLAGAPYLHMDCLYVREGWRGRAIGQRLHRALRAFAVDGGCQAMQWQTPEWNEAAARFYLRLGARETLKRRYVLPLDAPAAQDELRVQRGLSGSCSRCRRDASPP
jgi:GNAT superfamily N-acetyltransferase